MKLLLNTHSTNEYSEGCEYAFLDLDVALATLILERFERFETALTADSNLTEMAYYGAEAIFLDGLGNEDLDALFDNGPDFVETENITAENFEDLAAPTECDRMVICRQEVYWNCYPKHCDWQVETRPIPIDIVRKAAGVEIPNDHKLVTNGFGWTNGNTERSCSCIGAHDGNCAFNESPLPVAGEEKA